MNSDYFFCLIPILPPGINQTYKTTNIRGQSEMYKSKEAIDWAEKAALIIGSRAAELDFFIDKTKTYEISMKFYGMRHDVDAPVKLVIDTVFQKLGFDDRILVKQCSEKIKSGERFLEVLLNLSETSI